jgi:hypothetical protein
MNRADELIETLTSTPDRADDGLLANDLLGEFHRGFPVERLRPLLRSKNATVVRAASFIADELGAKAAPLLDTVFDLLNYPDRHVRGDVIGTMLTCTTVKNEKQLAAVIMLLEDSDWPIRWKTMEFMSLASLDQLRAALRHLESSNPESEHVSGLRWLTSEGGRNPDQIRSWSESDYPLKRKYGVVAATRIASGHNRGRGFDFSGGNAEPLIWAASVADDDIKQFASSILEMRAAAQPVPLRAQVKRRQYGLLCPNCTAVLSTPDPKTNEIVCHHCGQHIELV